MAFNQPIEADNPDLDHLTTFSQAPILGTIMWLLGGDMTLKLDGEKKKGTRTRNFTNEWRQ